MKSLVVSRFRPDRPASGAALRNWQNIRGLSRLGPVDVASIGVDTAVDHVEGVREWTAFAAPAPSAWRTLRSRLWLMRPGVLPSIERFHLDPAVDWIMRRAARQRYDVVVIEGIALARYIMDVKRAGCPLVVFDAHNVESSVQADVVSTHHGPVSVMRRLTHQIAQRRLAEVERCAVTSADAVWACSDCDAHQIQHLFRPAGPVVVVPNGVDVEAYNGPATHAAEDWRGTPITLVYPGLFSYPPNEDAALRLIHEVLPALRARRCEARVTLVGRDPTEPMLDAARRDPGVVVTGSVESVVPYLQQRSVVAVPLRFGGGTRLKIIEAFAAGCPVVSTAKGAEGLSVVDGEHLLIREDTDAMTSAILDIWNGPRLRGSLCAKALELVRCRYSWQAAAEAIAASVTAIRYGHSSAVTGRIA